MKMQPDNPPSSLVVLQLTLLYFSLIRSLTHMCSCFQQGCGHQVGLELPAYVIGPGRATYQQCLVADLLEGGAGGGQRGLTVKAGCTAKHASVRLNNLV
jgi:hypothetical protein